MGTSALSDELITYRVSVEIFPSYVDELSSHYICDDGVNGSRTYVLVENVCRQG